MRGAIVYQLSDNKDESLLIGGGEQDTDNGTVYQWKSGNNKKVEEPWYKLPKEKRDKTRFVCAHSPLITGIPEFDNAKIFTMLRDPVERVKSFCRAIYDCRLKRYLYKYPPNNFDLDGLLREEDMCLSNTQVKWLIGDDPKSTKIKKIGNGMAKSLALHNLLTKIHVYGIFEYFDYSVKLIGDKIGIPITRCAHDNKCYDKEALKFSDEQIDFIRKRNALDIDLYQWAWNIFVKNNREQLKAAGYEIA